MEKSKRKELESKVKIAITAILKNIDVSGAIKSEKVIKQSSKEIVKKFSKAIVSVKKKLAVARPLTIKRKSVRKKARSVAVKKKK